MARELSEALIILREFEFYRIKESEKICGYKSEGKKQKTTTSIVREKGYSYEAEAHLKTWSRLIASMAGVYKEGHQADY